MFNYRGQKISDNGLIFNNHYVKGGREVKKDDLISQLKGISYDIFQLNCLLDLQEKIHSMKTLAEIQKEQHERAELKRLTEKYS